MILLAIVATGSALLPPGPSPAIASSRSAPLLAPPGAQVRNEYIVVLKAGSAAGGVARRYQARPRHVYSWSLTGFAAKLTPAQLARLRRDSSVDYVIPDGPLASRGFIAPAAPVVSVQERAPWGLDRIDQPTPRLDGLYHYATTGRGTTAYIIDSGIYPLHSEIVGRVGQGFSSISDGRGTTDCMGHGTHVAGMIGGRTYGVAKDARLIPVRILDCQGSGTYAGAIAAVDWVTANHRGPSVANMSVGGLRHQALDDAVLTSIGHGVTYVLAAGNSGTNACAISPASTPAALTVAAVDWTDGKPAWSNGGPCVDLFAPGVSITSAWSGGPFETRTLSGTSMAAPHVTGLATLYLQANPTADPATVQAALVSAAARGTSPDPNDPRGRIARKWTGVLPVAGAFSDEPDGGYWQQQASGQVDAWLVGSVEPDMARLEADLESWTGSRWAVAARSSSSGSAVRLGYRAPPGFYRIRVKATGRPQTYDLWTIHPG